MISCEMSKYRKEKADPEKHIDYMTTSHVSGIPVGEDVKWVYLVRECSFTFQFTSLQQIEVALTFFSKKIHPSTRSHVPVIEHYWQKWFERLPAGLNGGTKRLKILKALQKAFHDFQTKNE